MQNNIHNCLSGEEEILATKMFEKEALQRADLMLQIMSIIAYIEDNSYLDKLIALKQLYSKEEII
jgi:hypothetical protein